jgi:hypothetical protein
MPYLSGVLTGILLTLILLFLVDHYGTNSRIVNWDVLAEKLGAVKEQVREDVHEATAPDKGTGSNTPTGQNPSITP